MVTNVRMVLGENGLPLQHREGSRRTVNARRAGVTKPGKIELIAIDDPRNYSKYEGFDSHGQRYVENRADRRSRGHRSSYKRSPHKRSVKAAPKPKRGSDDSHS